MTRARTLPQLFETSADRFADAVMMLEKRGARYEGTTYAAMRVLVHRFAAGLMSLGLEKGDRVALISEGRNAWVMAELGILYCGAINVPVSVKIDELDDLKFRLLHAGCRMAIVSQGQVGEDPRDQERPPGPDADNRARRGRGVRRGREVGGRRAAAGRCVSPRRARDIRGAVAVDRGARLRQHLLHLRHHRGPEGHRPDAPELHRQHRAGRGDDRAAPRLGAAEHPALGSRLRPHVRDLHDDDERRHARVDPGRPDADGHAQEHPGEHPRDAADVAAQRPGPGEELPQEHREGRARQRRARRSPVREGPQDRRRVQRGWLEPRNGQADPEAAPARALRRPHLPQDPRELRRSAPVHRRRRRPARHRAAALLLRHRHARCCRGTG